jgi:hypothetical protein
VKVPFVVASFIAVNTNEVTKIDNTQWLSIHLYVVQNWKRIPILLCAETISTSAIFDNIYALMSKCLGDFGGLELEDLVRKLVNIDYDSSSVFQGHKIKVTQQFKEKVAPFITGVHCFAHKTNLIIITLLDVMLAHRLELLLQSFYAFFVHSLKKFVEFQKLADLLQLPTKHHASLLPTPNQNYQSNVSYK